jgi:archaellin
MSVSAINGDTPEFALKSLAVAVSLDQTAKGSPSAVDQVSNQTQQPSAVDSIAVNNSKISQVHKQDLNARLDTNEKTLRTMSHVVETYNQQGKVRIKFMDSKNHVVYQIPTEMVAKMEDQMMKPETSANTKG